MSGPGRREKLRDIAKIAEALRDPVDAPDLTSSILERVHAQRPFVDARTRQWVPFVRVGAAAVAALGVFAVTLIIFIKPTLPEQLGAAPSVTTELFNSAEHGVTSSVASLRDGMRSLSAAADPRRLVPAPSSEAFPPEPDAPSMATVASAPLPIEPVRVTVAPVVFPLQSPLPVSMSYAGLPRRTTLEQVGVSTAEVHAILGGTHGANLSRYKTSLASFTPPMTSPKPGVNRTSPALVKDLVDFITGQPGDDPVLR
jgi:hypothetical protein